MALQHLRSSTANKRPTPAAMSDGQLAMNTNLASPGLFFKDSNGDLVKVGPVHVGTTAPNATPAAGGQAGNSVGEQWLDTTGGIYVFKVWDGSAWRSESGTFVDVNGDTMTGALGIIAGTAAAPGVFFSGDTNTGIYSPGADQLAVATNGTGRLFVDASGNVGINTTPSSLGTSVTTLEVKGGSTTRSGGLRVSSSDSSAKGAFYIYDGAGVLGTESATPLDLYTGNSPRLRITDAGLVGIGTSAPTNTAGFVQQVEIAGTLPCLTLNQNNAGFTTRKYSLAVNATGDFGIWDNTPSAYRLYINTSGNVGIGTTSPTTTLMVNGNIGSNGRGTSFGYTLPDWRIYNSSSGNALVIDNYTTEALRVDSANRLLVGTSTARSGGPYGTAGLQVESTSYSNASISAINNENTSDGVALMLGKSRGGSLGSTTIVSLGDQVGGIYFQGADGSALRTAASILAEIDGTPGANDMPGRLVLSTTADGASSPTERLRIGNSGFANLFVTANDGFQSRNSSAAGTSSACFAGRHTATGTTDGTLSFVVWTNGNVQNTNNSYTAISDIKLKENIVDANSQWDDLKALRVRNYNLKEGQTHTQIGLVAQEVEPISPGLVYESPDRDEDGNDLGTVTKSVNYSVLYMKAVKALQEAMERIETLEAKVAALEGA